MRVIAEALSFYERLGFNCSTPACPLVSSAEEQPARPTGAGNVHIALEKSIIELVSIVSEDAPLPPETELIPWMSAAYAAELWRV